MDPSQPSLNVLLVAIGSHGDVHPFVGVGGALKRRGHRVTVLSNDHFESLIRSAGLEFASLGTDEEFRQVTDNREIWHRTRGWKAIFEVGVFPLMSRTFDALEQRLVPGRTVVVASTLGFGARVLQESRGVPTITLHLAPAIFRSAYASAKMPQGNPPSWTPPAIKRLIYRFADWAIIDRALKPSLESFRSEKGLKPTREPMLEWWNSPQRVLGAFPAWFAAPQPDWPQQTRLTGFPLYDETDIHDQRLPADLEKFLADGSPPIAFTPGSAMVHGREFFEASAEACRLMTRRGLLLTRHGGQIPSRLPPGVIHVPFAPFSLLLPKCAAIVHHGGIGTSSQGLAAGVPALVMPMSHDQFDNADRLKTLGVADEINEKRYRPKRVAKKLSALIESPTVQSKCKEAASRFIGFDPLSAACEEIESFARETSAPLQK